MPADKRVHAASCLRRLKSPCLPHSDVQDNEFYTRTQAHHAGTRRLCTAARTPCALERGTRSCARRSALHTIAVSMTRRAHSPRGRARGPWSQPTPSRRTTGYHRSPHTAPHALALPADGGPQLQPPPLKRSRHDVCRESPAALRASMLTCCLSMGSRAAFVFLDDKQVDRGT